MPVGTLKARVRESARSGRIAARSVTSGWRASPDFLVIGAQKAGTTSLYAYLSAHPEVIPAIVKEAHYFDVEYARGPGWYRSLFPLRARMAAREKRLGRGILTGEASPYYLFHPTAPQRAADMVPEAKLVVLLRDPVVRAWSHYRHEVAARRETETFVRALELEPQRLAGAEEAVRSGGSAELQERHRTASYVARGRYAEQLERWLQYYPRSSLLALRAEDLFERPETAWAQLTGFLGLDGAYQPSFDVHNSAASGKRSEISGMPESARETLIDAFREPNLQLQQLLGDEYRWTQT